MTTEERSAAHAFRMAILKRPAVLVFDSDVLGDDADFDWIDEVASRTGAVVIVVPGGKVEELPREEAIEALRQIVEKP